MFEKIQPESKLLQERDKGWGCGRGEVLRQRYEEVFGFQEKFIE